MEVRLLFFAGIVAVVVIVLAAFLGWIERQRRSGKETVRRGTGNAMLGLQQFIEPSVEYIFQAENVEQREDDRGQGQGRDEDAVRSDLAESLGRAPIDAEEVRGHLASAARMGLDWRTVFEQAVADELRGRPFRAPPMPPANRVAPRI